MRESTNLFSFLCKYLLLFTLVFIASCQNNPKTTIKPYKYVNFESLALFILFFVTIRGFSVSYITKSIKLFYVQSIPANAGILSIII